MPMPTKWDLTLPVLELSSDGQNHPVREMIPVLADRFNLSQEEREQRLKSGERRFNNRTRWAAWVLARAKLLKKTGTATFQITDEGRKILKTKPEKLDVKYLYAHTDYKKEVEKWTRKDAEVESEEETEQTPEEIIEIAHNNHNDLLAAEILDTIMSCSPQFFEQLVVDVLLAMKYGGSRDDAGEALGRSGDGGVDGIIKEDMLGLDSIYIQAKRWANTVGSDVVRNFVGALELKKAKKGIIITTSEFSKSAKDYVKAIEKKIALIDGAQLANYMIQYNVGVDDVATYSVKRLKPEYFEE
ncbi:restriction endonuclease [Candidatus Thorarchaeota archaeon]|nr:MAG: restriction endonuclease [Candidatus Thorarchaeota archaeon]